MSEKKKTGKKHKYMIIVFSIGILFTAAVFYSGSQRTNIIEDHMIVRNELGKGGYDLSLGTDTGDVKANYEIHIDERVPVEEELLIMAGEADKELDTIILSENPSMEEVTNDLFFPLKLDGYPFSIRWTSSDEDVISNMGKIMCQEGYKDEHEVQIETVLVYGQFRQKRTRNIKVIPRRYSVEDETRIELGKSINDALEESIHEKMIVLPETINNHKVIYSESEKNNAPFMLVATFVLTAAIGYAVSYDESIKHKKYIEGLKNLYPGFVEKMKLYMVSGLTARNAIYAIRDSYKESGEKYAALTKELNVACNKYQNGVSEEKIFLDLGSSCGEVYRRFCFLLTVNLKQGNDKIITLLDDEVAKAFESRKERARKKGEEASVKLLFPMLLMLVMTMVIIIIPAYMNFT
ncbi:MAG: hypothetical protein K6A38_05530 [Lachnospiraceae bacterium]|nr:hypothetical protein [Lachnospiraceae bacterium]